MKIVARSNGATRLAGALRQRAASPEIDHMLRDAADALRAEAARELAGGPAIDAREADEALTVTPLPDGTGYSVTIVSDEARVREFGSLKRPSDPWFTRAVAAALPLINHLGRTLIRRLGAASRSHSGD